MTPQFSTNNLDRIEFREQIKQTLRGVSWPATVKKLEGKNIVLEHPWFRQSILLRMKSIPPETNVSKGDILSVIVSVALETGSGHWYFAAQIAPPGIPTAAERTHVQEERKTVTSNPPQPNLGKALADLKTAAREAVMRDFRIGPQICIYIDECWPGIVSDSSPDDTGVLAGVVWNGSAPDPSLLPFIRTHLSRTKEYGTLAETLTRLLRCKRAFPFIIPVTMPGRTANAHYFELVKAGLKILLGWIIRPTTIKHNVSIYLEQFSSYADRVDYTGYFNGIFDEAREAGSNRFKPWALDRVLWEGKEFEYIPYADVIAWPVHEHTPVCQRIAHACGYRSWPGYFPLTLDLLPKLVRLDSIGSLRNMDDLLDILESSYGTHLCKTVSSEAALRLRSDPSLREELLHALEMRYTSKHRDLRKLRRMIAAVAEIVDCNSAPPRISLLWALIRLQAANHDGDPSIGEQMADKYRQYREPMLDIDRELVAAADLNYIVHLNDLWRWNEARSLNARLVDDPATPYLPLKLRGQIISSYGQCQSIAGDYREADGCFSKAISHFEMLSALGESMAGDIDQTAVYAAINAIDGDLENCLEMVVSVLGSLDQAIVRLAGDDGVTELYHHHLLTRVLWYRGELAEERQAYLALEKEWKYEGQHPWELICLYRALVAFHEHPDEIAGTQLADVWFEKALEVASETSHGATLKLIAAVIAAVAECCVVIVAGDRQSYGMRAMQLVKELHGLLPQAGMALEKLENILSDPSPDQVNVLLGLLPFNYH